VTALIGTLDDVRRSLLARLLRVPSLRAIFVAPALRIPAASLASVAFALVAALAAPLISLWLGAALLGVPHVVAGVRYVAVRRRLRPLTAACTAIAIAIGAAQIAGAGDWAVRAFVVVFAVAALGELAGARPRAGRGVALAAAIVAVAALGLVRPAPFLLVLVHLHALGSVIYFAWRARARGVPAWPLLVAVAAIVALAATGGLDGWLAARLWAPRSAARSIVLEAAGASLADLGSVGARRLLFLYAFGQAIHFAVWLRLVPEVERPAPVPHTFRRALALLRADLGRWTTPVLVGCALAAPLILVGGGRAREAYFALTYFHIGLEAAVLVGMAAG
jgi:hypothetical protein